MRLFITFWLIYTILYSILESTNSTCNFNRYHPPRYPVFHLRDNEKIIIDGNIGDKAWQNVPWTSSFIDIAGKKESIQPWFETKVKMRYDNSFLYFAAFIEETEIWATMKERNSVVFRDDDFEIFLDPTGSTHNYKEFEVNAINTTWNLLLNKPYLNGGHENSTRVDKSYGFDMLSQGMKSAVYIKGSPNHPNQKLKYWTVEVALPLKSLVYKTSAAFPPANGTFWRINFSRVEWLVQVVNGKYKKIKGLKEENWVWSPQFAVDMHKPENWGYVQFLNEYPGIDKESELSVEWSLRYITFEYYYAQELFFKKNKVYSKSLANLAKNFKDKEAIKCISVDSVQIFNGSAYQANISIIGNRRLFSSIRDDRFIEVHSEEGLNSIKREAEY